MILSYSTDKNKNRVLVAQQNMQGSQHACNMRIFTQLVNGGKNLQEKLL